MDELLDYLRSLVVDFAPTLFIVLIIAAAFFLPLAWVNLRLLQLARKARWIFHILALLSLLYALAVEYIILALLPLTGAGNLLAEQVGQTLLWLTAAFLAQQGLLLFFWEGRFPRRHGTPPPGLLVWLTGGALWLAAAYAIMTFVFAQPMTGFIVSSGIVIGVVGLAMQNSLSDLVAGVAISIERPFRMGDWIELDDGTLGEVVDINWRATHVRSWEHNLYIVPNARVSNARILNYNQPRRYYGHWFKVHIPADVPPETAKRVLMHATVACPAVLEDPAPMVRTIEAGASWTYRVIVYFESFAAHPRGMDDLLMRVWLELARHGIVAASVTSETVLRRGEPSKLRGESPAELLDQVTLFEGLDADTRTALVGRLGVRSVRAGEDIVRQGEEGRSMFLIATGLVRILISIDGAAPREVAKLSNGQYFGEMSLLAHEPRTATVTAHTDCRLLEIGEDAMRAVFDHKPELMEQMARIVSERRMMNRAVSEEESQDDVARRIGRLTADLAGRIRAVFATRAETRKSEVTEGTK